MILPTLLLAACAKPSVAPPAQRTATQEGRRVLVVMNSQDADSVRIGKYYAAKRGVPKENLVLLSTAPVEEISQKIYDQEIWLPVTRAVVGKPVDYLLLVRGVPLRVKETGRSVDALLMSDKLPTQKVAIGAGQYDIAPNPYFGQAVPFRHLRYGMYLSCRLDGYTVADAMALVDRSVAAKPSKGPFLLDKADNRRAESYGQLQGTLDAASALLAKKGLKAVLDDAATFAGSSEPLAGYASWGSNDGKFSLETYRSLKFLPGALVETFVSTSGRTFRKTAGGQSLAVDLVAQGATGVKAYVSEPYTFALCKADVLFDRYTSGLNLADSFYAASPVAGWKDVVIGDPLCAPYRK